jgi:hypothetical protein
MESIICIVVSLTTLDPISLGTKMYLNDVLDTLEMQWMLISFIRKVLSPYNYWSQARMIGELLSTNWTMTYLGCIWILSSLEIRGTRLVYSHKKEHYHIFWMGIRFFFARNISK